MSNWINVNDKLPITYISGNWDGKKSDEVVVECANEKKYIACLYSGFMDGSEFNSWYSSEDWYLPEVTRWVKIQD